MQQICAFVFAYAKIRFSHAAAHLKVVLLIKLLYIIVFPFNFALRNNGHVGY